MAKKRTDLVWQEVKLDTLPKAIVNKFVAYQDAADLVKEAKAELNTLLVARLTEKKLIPEDHEVIVGYNWGKVSIAFAKADPTKPSAVKKIPISLA